MFSLRIGIDTCFVGQAGFMLKTHGRSQNDNQWSHLYELSVRTGISFTFVSSSSHLRFISVPERRRDGREARVARERKRRCLTYLRTSGSQLERQLWPLIGLSREVLLRGGTQNRLRELRRGGFGLEANP